MTLSDLSPVHTGDKVEFNTVDFVESRLLPKPATKSTVGIARRHGLRIHSYADDSQRTFMPTQRQVSKFYSWWHVNVLSCRPRDRCQSSTVGDMCRGDQSVDECQPRYLTKTKRRSSSGLAPFFNCLRFSARRSLWEALTPTISKMGGFATKGLHWITILCVGRYCHYWDCLLQFMRLQVFRQRYRSPTLW